MTIAVHECPHCNARSTTFQYYGAAHHQETWNAYSDCPACHYPLSARFTFANSLDFNALEGNILSSQHYAGLQSFEIFPAQRTVTAPQHLPDIVAKAYIEAEKARLAGLYTPACATYRRVMELALKKFTTDVEAWKLEKRVKELHRKGLITTSLFDWAEQLRLDGNAAIHGDEEADQELAEQMHGLTEMLLVYLYTMPQKIAEMRGLPPAQE